MQRTTAGAVLLLASAVALGQGGPGDRRQGQVPPAGFWPTEEMVDLAIDRIVDEMAREYAFDEAQVASTQELIKTRYPEWMERNRPALQTLTNEWIVKALRKEPPTAAEVADWAQRARPLFEEFSGMLVETSEHMRTYMTDEQQVLLDGQLAAMNVGLNFMRGRLDGWAEGKYDWHTEWPRSREFEKEERARHDKVMQDAKIAEQRAMGLTPDEGAIAARPGDSAGAATVSSVDPGGRATTAVRGPADGSASKPAGGRDEWAAYVQEFIRRYQLDEAQCNSAKKFLESAQQQRDKYLQGKLARVTELEQKLAAAKTDEDRTRARTELDQVQKPIDRIFTSLKDKLDSLPTRKQRAAAAQSEMAARVKAENPKKAEAHERAEKKSE